MPNPVFPMITLGSDGRNDASEGVRPMLACIHPVKMSKCRQLLGRLDRLDLVREADVLRHSSADALWRPQTWTCGYKGHRYEVLELLFFRRGDDSRHGGGGGVERFAQCEHVIRDVGIGAAVHHQRRA